MLSLLVVLAGFAVVSVVSWRVERSWIAPSTVWPIGWGLYAIATIPYMAEPLDFVPGTLWILLNCAVFLVGSALSRGFVFSRVRWSGEPKDRFPYLLAIVSFLALAGIASLAVAVRSLGFSVVDLFSFQGLARMSALSRAVFYFGDIEQGGLARILVVLAYTGPAFGGLYFAITKRLSHRVIGLMPLFAITLVGMVYGSRMGVLFGGSFWLAAFLAGRLLDTADRPAAGTRLFFMVGGLSFGLLAGVSTGIQFIRYFVGNQKTADLILADPFGFLAAWATWFRDSGRAEDGLAAGFYSFERIGRMLGFDRPAFPAIDLGFTSSNVYTVFRALIEDYGAFGSLIVVLAIGFVGSLAYRAVVAGRSSWLGPLSLVYAFMFVGMALSLFAYTGPTAGAICFVAYLLVVGHPRSIVRRMLFTLGQRQFSGGAPV
jgi:oligosaccharide repeat unit polymerase